MTFIKILLSLLIIEMFGSFLRGFIGVISDTPETYYRIGFWMGLLYMLIYYLITK